MREEITNKGNGDATQVRYISSHLLSDATFSWVLEKCSGFWILQKTDSVTERILKDAHILGVPEVTTIVCAHCLAGQVSPWLWEVPSLWYLQTANVQLIMRGNYGFFCTQKIRQHRTLLQISRDMIIILLVGSGFLAHCTDQPPLVDCCSVQQKINLVSCL